MKSDTTTSPVLPSPAPAPAATPAESLARLAEPAKAKAKTAPAPSFRLADVADAPARAAEQVRHVASVCRSVGLPVPDAAGIDAMASHAGREAALSLNRDGASGRVSAKGGAEAVAKFDWETVAVKAGTSAFLPAFVAGSALVAAASKYRKATK